MLDDYRSLVHLNILQQQQRWIHQLFGSMPQKS